jgi:hypothetical protein
MAHQLKAFVVAIAFISIGLTSSFAQDAQGVRSAPIDRNGVLLLIRSTLLAVDQANKTGNYTVLRDLGAPGFQASNNAARLGEIFAGLRRNNIDLSGVAVLEPQLTLLPEIESNGMMRMTGFFPSVPVQVKFDLLYAPVNGQWRLFGIAVGLGQSGPYAPAPAAQTVSMPAPKPAPSHKHRASASIKKHEKPDESAPL